MAQLRRALAFLRALFLSDPHLLETRTGRLHPILGGAEGDDDETEDDDTDREEEEDDDEDDEDDDTVDSESDDDVKPEDNWKTKSRKNEAQAKRAKRRAEKLEADLKKLRDADKSEQQKAIDKAKDEGRAEAEKDRRGDRLELEVSRLALRGFKVKNSEGEEETVKFADDEIALVLIERAISKGEIDEDDIFDEEGKVEKDALRSALEDLLEEKPSLRAGAEKGNGKPKGDPDARKGDPAGKDLESMSPEDHAKRKYPANK